MKKSNITLLTFLGSFLSSSVFAKTSDTNIMEKMAPTGNSIINVEVPTDGSGISLLDGILGILRDTTFGVLPTVAIFIFLLIGAKLFIARGNQEEFKKALMWFVYAAIGLSIIPMAWGIIYLITTLNI